MIVSSEMLEHQTVGYLVQVVSGYKYLGLLMPWTTSVRSTFTFGN